LQSKQKQERINMQLLQQSLRDNNDFTKTDDPDWATHYIGNDGHIRVLGTGQLVGNVPEQNQHKEEPLILPTMNFGGEEKREVKTTRSSGEEPLVLPVMSFENVT
jgi:hypothetical protein